VVGAGIVPGELVLDVGAGTGALTRHLVEAGARVVAVELHPKRVEWLRREFGDRVTVVRADAADLRLPRRPFRVVANPPYAITTALLRRLLAPGSRLTRADLVVQDWSARRWATGRAPGAGRWLRDFEPEVAARVPRSAFVPTAQVVAAVLVVRRVNEG
jgi:23S rRNA (adenine-N6)-dimethyltransferase